MKKAIYITLGSAISIIILLNIFLPEPKFTDKYARLDFLVESKQYEKAESLYRTLLLTDSININLHYNYIYNHFQISHKNKRQGFITDNKEISDYYLKLSEKKDSNISNIGKYCKGLILLYNNEPDYAIIDFDMINDHKLKFLNNSLGYAYEKKGDIKNAEEYFRKEISNKGFLSGAYANLFSLLADQYRFKELKYLLKDKDIREYADFHIEQLVSFYNGDVISYIIEILKEPVRDARNYLAFISAFLILLCWLFYLRKIDIFEPESWKNISLVFLTGSFCVLIATPLYHFFYLILNFRLSGNIINDFFYSIIVIGGIEELVKILPLLFLIRFTKIINEPIDYIIYASVSALGFAFIENIRYFNNYGIEIVHGRALVSVVLHMFCSSVIAYGLVLNNYKLNRNKYLNFLLFYAIAACVHGLFDFFLINENLRSLSILSILILFSCISMFNSFITNSLNQSSFFNESVKFKRKNLQIFLIVSLSSILMFEYTALSFKYCVAAGNNALGISIVSGTYLIAFLGNNLSNINIQKGRWMRLNYRGVREKIDYSYVFLNNNFELQIMSQRFANRAFLPATGMVVKTCITVKKKNCLLFKIDKNLSYELYEKNHILVCPQDKDLILDKDSKAIVGTFLIRNLADTEKKEINMNDFAFAGWAKMAYIKNNP